MRKIISLCALLAAFFVSFSAPVKYVTCNPSDGSEITSWNFTLEFDITDALDAAKKSNPDGEYGIGVQGANTSARRQYTTLYKGDAATGEILGLAHTNVLNGKSPDFKVNGNTVNIKFDEQIPIIKGQKYTLEIKNNFYLYIKDKATMVSSTKLEYFNNPLILTFYGGDLSDSKLFVESCSIDGNNQVETLSSLTFDLNTPFTISEGGKVLVKDGENIVASADKLTVSADNPKQLIAEFAEPVNLKYNVKYTIQVPEGTLIHKDNNTISNTAFETNVIGASSINFGAVSSSPSDGSKALPENVSIAFDIPEGFTLKPKSSNNPSGHTTGAVYVNGEENFILKTKGSYCNNNKGFSWDLSNIKYIPSTTYYLKKDKGTIYVYDESGNHLPDYVNDEVTISWTTPSVEEVNLPLLTGSCYESPKLGVHNDHSSPAFKDGGTYSHIETIEYRKIKDTYEYEGNKYNVIKNPDVTWKLYDVTSGSRVFIKDIKVFGAERETTMWDSYYVDAFGVHSNFYAGHTYEIVLEENGLTSSTFPANMKNYLRSEEVVIRIVGSKQLSEPELLHKSISDNEKVDALYTALWVFDGDLDLKEGAKVGFSTQYPNSQAVTYYYPLSAEKDNGKTYVSASFISKTSATPETFTENVKCKFIFPANVFTLAGMGSIPNKEIVTTFTGVVKNTSGAEMVNVSLNINGVHSTSYKAVKGLPVSFTLAHDSNWIAESVSHNGTEVEYKDGIYTTTSLFNQENNIEAKLRFAVESLVDGTTGVAQLPDSNITVYTEQQHVIISGLTGNEIVSVYSMNGMLVNEHPNTDYTDLRISVAPGIYVVLVVDADGNRKAAKVKVD